MTVWRINLLPGDGENQFGFCYQRGIIGIGWQVCWKNPALPPTTTADYLKRVNKIHKGDRGRSAAKIIAREMRKHDFVWVLNHKRDDGDSRLYLGQIEGDWEYRNTYEYQHADIVSVRRCKLYEVRSVDLFETKQVRFRKAANEFFSKTREKFKLGTIRPIADKNFVEHTERIWKKIQKEI